MSNLFQNSNFNHVLTQHKLSTAQDGGVHCGSCVLLCWKVFSVFHGPDTLATMKLYQKVCGFHQSIKQTNTAFVNISL